MTAPREYRAARKALLDAMGALAGQSDSIILVGAQAIYLRVGHVDIDINVAPTTTDADLALNADLLTPIPNLSAALHAAGFSTGAQPGTWTNPEGVSVDLMVCPHQGGRTSPAARGARLGEHGHPEARTARITPGLEPALVDHDQMTLLALDESDPRTVVLNVAGPAAMLVAKLTKLRERMEDRRAGRPDRTKPKDVIDIFRLLVGTSIDELRTGFARHGSSPEAARTSHQALEFVGDDLRRPGGSDMRAIFATEVGRDAIQVARWDALIRELQESMPG
jgi:hypothetical protein